MLSTLFGSSTIPVLEQTVNFTQARHGVLAGNIANLNTPGYKTRDLSPVEFQKRLKEVERSSGISSASRHFPYLCHQRQAGRSIDRYRPRRHGESPRIDEKHSLPRRQRHQHRKTSCRNQQKPSTTQYGSQFNGLPIQATSSSRDRTSLVDKSLVVSH